MPKKILFLIVFVFTILNSFAQIIEVNPKKEAIIQQYNEVLEEAKAFHDNTLNPCRVKRDREFYNTPEWKDLDKKLKELKVKNREIQERIGKLWGELNSPPFCKLPYNFPNFTDRADITKYIKSITDYYYNYPNDEKGGLKKGLIGHCVSQITQELKKNPNKYIGAGTTKTENTSNLEAGFLAEIAKINAGITKINRLANERQLIASLKESQNLCDKIRLLQGRQYFSSTLKKIRRTNPGFSFSINALAEQLTPRYWQEMRNRANQAYHNALQAHSGCVYNEGIQTATYIEVPFRFFKATYDLVTNAQSMFSGSLWGSIDAIKNSYGYQDNIAQLASAAGKEVLAAGEDAKDWKSYVGVATGLLSAYNGYKTAFEMAKENYLQADLIVANRQTIDHLIKNSKNLLQQFDYYRAYLDAHLSAVDCLNDKLMRLNLDNKSIKGDKITIWGTGLYDWDGDEYLNQIKEAGEDLKNEYIYCEDFIKSLQIAIYLAQENYNTIEEKVKNSGADQTQINDQLSQNRTNGDWFEKESTRLSELYAAFCENEDNTMPDDVEVVSTSIIPGVEEQNGDPDAPPVWENSDDEVYNPANEPEYNEPEQNNGNTTTDHGSTSLIISKGNGWSAQKIENNPASIKNDINNAIKSGKTPAGIYISDGTEVVVFYLDGNPLGMTSWSLDNYTDGNTLQNGITKKMQEGYFPMGISFTEQGNLYVLYIKSKVKASAWQLVESKPDLSTVSSNMQKWLNQSFVPVGITIFNEMYYTLLIQLTDVELKNWVIEGYEDNASIINQNVNTKTASGLLPFGYLKQRGVVNILYVGF